ncbi:N-acetyl-gamma-glutamyl-phosphate reductase [Caldimicrobium thiodismutans]|uniref:N-acetyl-gamma-glutamyl-phosphate reductase n=1 Tax=Caldimicrobium thiodismutans TaxID=1653476 RepID=A0A0U4W4W8_9BACT|nr:N-acetyl-gamma-glutamyl-phosphate reductase [Caldimicrobium thiodismutans]BAU24106.1 N-acetyl-gamma-glutamyl-phosphate reductase [Caldimicrobium thiodismutans]
MISVAIVGASGYTGLELLRLLSYHPEVEVTTITSRELAGKCLSEVYGFSGKFASLIFEEPDPEVICKKAQAVFLCLPAGKSQEMARIFLENDLKVIDLSADFRFKNLEVYQKTYKIEHKFPELAQKAVYGLPEIYGEEIKEASLIGNPGCYPTSVLIPLIPLLMEGLIEKEEIIVDSKSGTSGAGRKAENYYSFCEVNEDFKAYKVADHRHTPEMEEKLSQFAGTSIRLIFTPHLLPVNRGIFSTIYVKFRASLNRVYEYLRDFYKDKPFVEVLSLGRYPRISEVRGTNFCKFSLFEDKERGRGIILSVIDNLVKGASGQAIQNLNLIMGLPEDLGLPKSPLFV